MSGEPVTAVEPVVVEALGRRWAGSHASFASPRTIWSRLFGGSLGPAGGGDADDDDDDLDEPEEEPRVVAEEGDGQWALRDVSFSVEAGAALAVVGGKASGDLVLMRVLSRMLAPDEGRALLRGRVSPTMALGIALTRVEASPRYHARVLAAAAGVPRGDRKDWIERLFEFAGTDGRGRRVVVDQSLFVRRLIAGACVDPEADVLLVDDLPALGDPDFRDRCLERLSDALARGCAAVVAGPEPAAMLQLCRDGLLLEDGKVAEHGAPVDLLEELERRNRRPSGGRVLRVSGRRLPGFNEHAAILGVAVEHHGSGSGGSSDGSAGAPVVEIELETAFRESYVRPSLVARGTDAASAVALSCPEPLRCRDAGRYLLTAELEGFVPGTTPIELDVVLDLRARGIETSIGRQGIGALPAAAGAGVVPPAEGVDFEEPEPDLGSLGEVCVRWRHDAISDEFADEPPGVRLTSD